METANIISERWIYGAKATLCHSGSHIHHSPVYTCWWQDTNSHTPFPQIYLMGSPILMSPVLQFSISAGIEAAGGLLGGRRHLLSLQYHWRKSESPHVGLSGRGGGKCNDWTFLFCNIHNCVYPYGRNPLFPKTECLQIYARLLESEAATFGWCRHALP